MMVEQTGVESHTNSPTARKPTAFLRQILVPAGIVAFFGMTTMPSRM